MTRGIFNLSPGGVLPDASTSQKGLVQLTSDSTATDDTTAATPGMVQKAIALKIPDGLHIKEKTNTQKVNITIEEYQDYDGDFCTTSQGFLCVILFEGSVNVSEIKYAGYEIDEDGEVYSDSSVTAFGDSLSSCTITRASAGDIITLKTTSAANWIVLSKDSFTLT